MCLGKVRFPALAWARGNSVTAFGRFLGNAALPPALSLSNGPRNVRMTVGFNFPTILIFIPVLSAGTSPDSNLSQNVGFENENENEDQTVPVH